VRSKTTTTTTAENIFEVKAKNETDSTEGNKYYPALGKQHPSEFVLST
jgi:hypothetical protein